VRIAGAAIAHFGNERVRGSRFHGHPGPRGTRALLLSFVEVAQRLLELLSRHRRKARAQHVELRRAEKWRKIAISGKTVRSAKSGIKANQWVRILIGLPPSKTGGNAGFRSPPLS
jgi:hypothetical protein